MLRREFLKVLGAVPLVLWGSKFFGRTFGGLEGGFIVPEDLGREVVAELREVTFTYYNNPNFCNLRFVGDKSYGYMPQHVSQVVSTLDYDYKQGEFA